MADNAGGEGGGGGRHCNLLTSRWKNCQVRLRLKRKMRSGGRCWGITRWKFRISSFFFFFIASEIWWDIDIDVDKNLSIRLLILFSQAIDDFCQFYFRIKLSESIKSLSKDFWILIWRFFFILNIITIF